MPGRILRELFELWQERNQRDEYFGTLVNAFLARGGEARAVRAGSAYVDVGTLHGYREAIKLLGERPDTTRSNGGPANGANSGRTVPAPPFAPAKLGAQGTARPGIGERPDARSSEANPDLKHKLWKVHRRVPAHQT